MNFIQQLLSKMNRQIQLIQSHMTESSLPSKQNLKSTLINICRHNHKLLKSPTPAKKTKSFMMSNTYTFLEDLIHLHCQQIKNTIKKSSSHVISLIQSGNQDLLQNNLLKEIEQITQMSNKRTVFDNLNRMIKCFLIGQCKNREQKEVQNIELEIQCSLNYTCPKCLKTGGKEGPTTLKVIDFATEPSEQSQNKTLTSIGERRRSKLDCIFDNLRKDRQKQVQVQRQKFNRLRKWWESNGDLLMLEENPYSTVFVQSTTLEERRDQIFQDLMFKNVTNRSMINNYCNKAERRSKRKKSARSLSVKPKETTKTEVDVPPKGRITSMNEVDDPRKTSCRKRRIVEAKSRIVAPVVGIEGKVSTFLMDFGAKRPFIPKRKNINIENKLQNAIKLDCI